MEKAVKQAIKGGWKDNRYIGWDAYCVDEIALLDPLFWQCLGKAEGWEPLKDYIHPSVGTIYTKDEYGYHKFTGPEWYENWHNFVDHLALGKSPDSFFDELIS